MPFPRGAHFANVVNAVCPDSGGQSARMTECSGGQSAPMPSALLWFRPTASPVGCGRLKLPRGRALR